MRRLLAILCLSLLLPSALRAQETSALDSTALRKLTVMLDEYVAALETEPLPTKMAECDYIIDTCKDSLLRQEVCLRLYNHYLDSKVMGDEGVAIHIFDRWFEQEGVRMRDELDMMNARIFARFNRQSLIGCKAPELTMFTPEAEAETLPREGRVSVLFFYDAGCPKCLMETVMLRQVLGTGEHAFDFYAVYSGDDREAWDEYVARHFSYETPGVTMHHLWDPEFDSGFQEAYGLLQTPRMLLVAPDGEIIGRGLDVESLRKLLGYADMLQDLYDRCPVGGKLPALEVSGERHVRSRVKSGNWRLDRFRGRPGYVIFHTEGCAKCRAQLEQVESLTASGARVLTVLVDDLWRSDEALAEKVFDAFDLTALPFVVEVDRRGRVVRRYVDLTENN